MGRFIALRELKESTGLIQPGSFVPGAEKWPHNVLIANVNGGYIYDLQREWKLDRDTLSAIRREDDLLKAALERSGSILVDDPDNPGWHMLAPAGEEARAIPAVQVQTPSQKAAEKQGKKVRGKPGPKPKVKQPMSVGA